MAMFLLIVYIALVISPLALVFLSGPYTDHQMLYELGKSFALMGLVILSLQFVLSSRQKWIERHFGLDMIFSFHKGMAVFAGILILFHPVLLAVGSGHFALLFSFDLPWYILLGKIGLAVILIQVLISAFRVLLKVKFETWRLIHNVLGGIILIGIYVHSWIAGGDLRLSSLRIAWGILIVIALASYIYHKFIMTAMRKKHAYSVHDVKQESAHVWTLALKPPEGEELYQYRPGQFHFITLLRDRNLPEEEHHFTISSSPTNREFVSSSIKESGDFTSTIKDTKVGDKALIEAPFGRFSYTFRKKDNNFIFIAGGIGITPLMSMLRHMRDKKSTAPVTLIYANHAEENIVFRNKLDDIVNSGYPKLQVIHVLDHPTSEWTGEKGYVTGDLLDKYIDNYENKAFYICCPPKMRDAMLKTLKDKNVKKSQIRLEIFSL